MGLVSDRTTMSLPPCRGFKRCHTVGLDHIKCSFCPIIQLTKVMRRDTQESSESRKCGKHALCFKTSKFAGDWEPVTDIEAKVVLMTIH